MCCSLNELKEMCDLFIDVVRKLWLYKKLMVFIKKVRKENKVLKDIGNILYVEWFLLFCIYLLDSVNYCILCELVFKVIK